MVHINDIIDIENVAYLIQYDSTYGRFRGKVTVSGPQKITIQDVGKKWDVRVTNLPRAGSVDWVFSGTECVIEATGVEDNSITSRETINGGVGHVIVANTFSQADFTLVLGVNEAEFDASRHRVISSSICDATAIAPVLKSIHDSCDIKQCFITTVHPWLSYQNLSDGPLREGALPQLTSRHYALGRASGANIIPKPTTVGTVIESLIPSLRDKIASFSYRVPTPVVCTADISLVMSGVTTAQRLVDLLGSLNSRLVRCSREMLVSTDYVGETSSAVVDFRWLNVMEGKYVKLVLWYDNEFGYASRIVDILDLIKNQSLD